MKYEYTLKGFVERLNKHTKKIDRVPVFRITLKNNNKYAKEWNLPQS